MWAENIPLAKNFSRPVGLVSEHHAPAYSQPVQVGVSTRIGPGDREAETQAHPAVNRNAHTQLPVTNTAVVALGIEIDIAECIGRSLSRDLRGGLYPKPRVGEGSGYILAVFFCDTFSTCDRVPVVCHVLFHLIDRAFSFVRF